MLLKNCSLSNLEEKYKAEGNSKIRERLQILIYLREGNKQREVSSMLRVSVGKVPLCKKRFEKEGFKGLRDKKGRGRKSNLSKEKLDNLDSEVQEGVLMKNGYRRGYKTKDVKIFIKKEFGVIYSDRHCTRILHALRFNLKVPRPRNKRRNQNSVDEFKQEFKKNLKVWEKDL